MKHRFLVPLFLLCSVILTAQEKDAGLTRAENAYENGRFESVITLLAEEAGRLGTSDRIQAYRLLTLSCLYLDRQEQAASYAASLLALDPFYTSYGDNPRFRDLLEKLKKGQSTVTTASRMAESVEEVPVPVTLITGEMIRACGAISLQEVLLQYVPGLSAISSLEDNVAMRGVYGLSQEGILVMLDGHRMNSQTTNGEPFDFRNSLGKIKQIEVLRGPASSLYGNVALTAVVNIITKDGTDVEGGQASALTGNHSRVGGSLMFGHGNLKFDFLAWASGYTAGGQQVDESTVKGPHYTASYGTGPTYDLGMKIRWGDLHIEVTGRHAHPIPVFNILDVTGAYDYKKYATVNGDGPGMARTDLRADVDWSRRWNRFTLSVTGHASSEQQQIYNTLGDTLNSHTISLMTALTGIQFKDSVGTRQIVNWESYGFGSGVNGSYEYGSGEGMSGSIIGGLQYENLTTGDACLMLGGGFNTTNYTKHDVVPKGSEHTISIFAQLKHYFTKTFIFNGGVRLDHKIRLDGRRIFTASPRLSLVWMPSEVFSVKGGYSHAFVDAAPFYRASTIALFSGGSSLDPEKMDSFQAGALFKWKHLGLNYEFNCFYNDVSDLVYFDLGQLFTQKGLSFSNAGSISMGGVENVLQLKRDRLFVNVNCTYQYPFHIGSFYSDGHSISNVPDFLFNAAAQYALWKGTSGSSLHLRTNVHFQTGFDSLVNSLILKYYTPGQLVTYRQSPYTLLNAGVEWRWFKGLDLSFDVRNILNTRYETGGQIYRGFPGESINFILKVSYEFGLQK